MWLALTPSLTSRKRNPIPHSSGVTIYNMEAVAQVFLVALRLSTIFSVEKRQKHQRKMGSLS
jgi:hypothetical protein